MKIQTFSYRYAEEILEHPYYRDAYNELIEICQNCPLPVYKKKSASQPKLDVVQQIINTYFKIAFEQKTWESEPLATPDNFTDSLKSDFRKKFSTRVDESLMLKEITVQIEVEMGNIASSYRNYFKFQLSYAHKLADIAVLILASDHLSKRIDSAVASYEKTVREIPSADLSITVPILVIGLFDEDTPEINIKDFEEDLTIVKGSKNNNKEQHHALVERIIKEKA
jgi:hypothetical protein